MDKPDRDYSKATHAEEEYRRMLTDYPDAPKALITQAKTRLREVQEVLATREAEIAAYYGTRDNYAAEIARYQTVADAYPLYSHMDDVLIGLGDAYEAEAQYVRKVSMPEGPKARLESQYDGLAAAEYRKVVLEHAAAAHVEDAKDRLAAMNLPIPEPSAEQLAASQKLEDSRKQYALTDRISIFLLHRPDTVTTAGMGDPSLTDPAIVTAPSVLKQTQTSFREAYAPSAAAAVPAAAAVAAPAAETPAAETAAPAAEAAPLAFKDVGTTPAAGSGGATPVVENLAPGRKSSLKAGSSIGVEVLTNAAATPDAANAATGKPDANYGLKAVAPANNTPLPPREAAAPAPDEPNQVTAATPAAQADPTGRKKAAKPGFDKGDESSSKHKKKKGLKKLDPLPQ
jgi:outer membrane protein assembly factor BamD